MFKKIVLKLLVLQKYLSIGKTVVLCPVAVNTLIRRISTE